MALEKEYNKHRGLAQESHSLQQDLRMIAAAMDDQQLSMGRSDAAARTAVARLHTEEMLDLAHDIEDCVDRFLHRLTCNHHKRGGAGAGSRTSSARSRAARASATRSRSSRNASGKRTSESSPSIRRLFSSLVGRRHRRRSRRRVGQRAARWASRRTSKSSSRCWTRWRASRCRCE